MSGTARHHHHRGGAAATAVHDDGWVEGITALQEGAPATSLLNEEPDRWLSPRGGGGAAPAGASDSAAAAGEGAPSESLDAAAEFEARLERGLAEMKSEVDHVGELVLEVGAPGWWGLPPLDPSRLEGVLTRLRAAADEVAADVSVIRTSGGGDAAAAAAAAVGAAAGCVADVLVRRRPRSKAPIEVRVAVIGNVDSGKSTLVGVLTRSMLDDGRGLARAKVFKHHHEEASGRTSSIGQHNLCLDARGAILNDALFRNASCADYVARASKVVTLVDLAGHERYFRTTAYGLTGHLPDYACLLVGANMGVVGMCKEHLGVALALKVPCFFIVTKVDIAPEHVLKHTVQSLASILKKPGVRKRPFLVRSVDDALLCARTMAADALAPIFLTSAVTGAGLDLVRLFYNLLPCRCRWADRQGEPAEFIVDETFAVPGVGTVVAGTVKRGVITHQSQLLLGPDISDGSFKPASIKSIHYKRLPVSQVVAGQTAALALKRTKRGSVRKGMVLVDARSCPVASWEFDADIAILTHSTTIQPKYQAVIHCEIVRQAARVVGMDKERLRSGDRAAVRFRFLQRPEYISPGARFVFREGRTKGIGLVVGAARDGPGGEAAAAAAGGGGSGGGGAGGGAAAGGARAAGGGGEEDGEEAAAAQRRRGGGGATPAAAAAAAPAAAAAAPAAAARQGEVGRRRAGAAAGRAGGAGGAA